MNCPLPCYTYGRFRLFKISTSDFGNVAMCVLVLISDYSNRRCGPQCTLFGVIGRHKVVVSSNNYRRFVEGASH